MATGIALRRVDSEGPVPRHLQIIPLVRCEYCVLWERSQYHVVGTCRRYPYPRMHAWEKCAHWVNRHGRRSLLDDFAAG